MSQAQAQALLKWVHTVADVVQQLAVERGMPLHADQISVATRELTDEIMLSPNFDQKCRDEINALERRTEELARRIEDT